VKKPRRKRVSYTCYFDPSQLTELRRLNRQLQVPVAAMVREGVDLVIEVRRAMVQKLSEPSG
jgi:hypothetical protein